MSTDTQKPIFCFSYFTAKEDCLKELIDALTSLIEPTKAEAGCLQYDLVQDTKDPNFLIMVEKFSSKQALDEHVAQPYISHFVDNIMYQLCDKVVWNEAEYLD